VSTSSASWNRGRRQTASIGTLQRIARALDVGID
jgi:hypothetical protein